MKIEQLQNQAERIYSEKGIAQCRYNTLGKVISFLKRNKIDDSSLLKRIDKNELKYLYRQDKGKALNDAEKQVFNDIYSIIMSSLTTEIDGKETVVANVGNLNRDYKQGLPPWVGNSPYILILGTMPGDQSIQAQSYYNNIANNSFWGIMYSILGTNENQSPKDYITSHHIALWDCIKSGIRRGSMDKDFDEGTIELNDIQSFLKMYPTIHTIVLNGKKAAEYFHRHFGMTSSCKVICLHSTSNANKRWISDDDKIREWSIIKNILISK